MTTGNQSARKKIFERLVTIQERDEKQSDSQRAGCSKISKSKNGEKVSNAY